jgi:FkbM family methyltransferase
MQNTRTESFVRYGQRNGIIYMLFALAQVILLKIKLLKGIYLKNTIFMLVRPNSSDLPALRQVFFDEEYRFNLNDPSVIIDLGANVGYATIYFKNQNPKAKIISVEPDIKNFNQLLLNTKKLKDVHCVNKAIWSDERQLYLDDSPNLGEWGIQVTKEVKKRKVQTTTILRLIDEFKLNSIDVLKIDIETAEEEIFKDSDWLKYVKILIVETHDRFKEGSSNNFIKAISKLDKFNICLSGENIVIYNLSQQVK